MLGKKTLSYLREFTVLYADCPRRDSVSQCHEKWTEPVRSIHHLPSYHELIFLAELVGRQCKSACPKKYDSRVRWRLFPLECQNESLFLKNSRHLLCSQFPGNDYSVESAPGTWLWSIPLKRSPLLGLRGTQRREVLRHLALSLLPQFTFLALIILTMLEGATQVSPPRTVPS